MSPEEEIKTAKPVSREELSTIAQEHFAGHGLPLRYSVRSQRPEKETINGKQHLVDRVTIEIEPIVSLGRSDLGSTLPEVVSLQGDTAAVLNKLCERHFAYQTRRVADAEALATTLLHDAWSSILHNDAEATEAVDLTSAPFDDFSTYRFTSTKPTAFWLKSAPSQSFGKDGSAQYMRAQIVCVPPKTSDETVREVFPWDSDQESGGSDTPPSTPSQSSEEQGGSDSDHPLGAISCTIVH